MVFASVEAAALDEMERRVAERPEPVRLVPQGIPLPASTVAMMRGEEPRKEPKRPAAAATRPYHRKDQKRVQAVIRKRLETEPKTTKLQMQEHILAELGLQMVESTVAYQTKVVRTRMERSVPKAAAVAPKPSVAPPAADGSESIRIASALGTAEIMPIGGGRWSVRQEFRSVTRAQAMSFFGQATSILYPES